MVISVYFVPLSTNCKGKVHVHVGINVLLCGDAWLGSAMVAAVVLQLEQVTGALGHDADKTLTGIVEGSFAALCIFLRRNSHAVILWTRFFGATHRQYFESLLFLLHYLHFSQANVHAVLCIHPLIWHSIFC